MRALNIAAIIRNFFSSSSSSILLLGGLLLLIKSDVVLPSIKSLLRKQFIRKSLLVLTPPMIVFSRAFARIAAASSRVSDQLITFESIGSKFVVILVLEFMPDSHLIPSSSEGR